MDEPIEVVAIFQRGRIRPARFRWNDKVYKVAEVTGDWNTDVGSYRVRHFAVVDGASNFFQLSYDERKTSWVISKIWVE